MARPFKDLRRAEIAELRRQNQQERDRIQAIIDPLQAEADAITGTDHESNVRSMRLSQRIINGNNEIIALLKVIQALQFEIHVRDTPDLVAQFGAGAD